MAAGQAVFDVVANDEFLAHVRAMGERLRSALEQMIPNHDHLFESVRGMGLMLGVKMKTDSRPARLHVDKRIAKAPGVVADDNRI